MTPSSRVGADVVDPALNSSVPVLRRLAPAERLTVRVRAPGEPRRVAYLYLAPAMLFYCTFAVAPLLYTVWLSFFRWDGLSEGVWIGLRNYERVLSDPVIVASFGHAFELILFYSVIPVCAGLLLAS